MKNLTDTSKFLSLILRHKPEEIGISLDEHGWADVGELIEGISEKMPFERVVPPDVLWHGTGEKYVSSIDTQGLIPKSRLYVHLSGDIQTAETVGKRHGRSVIYKVNSKEMHNDGYEFFLSVNGVWLTKAVPVKYLEKTEVIQ